MIRDASDQAAIARYVDLHASDGVSAEAVQVERERIAKHLEAMSDDVLVHRALREYPTTALRTVARRIREGTYA